MARNWTTHVLFLCTGNSARSIISEVLLNDLGAPRFKAYSAGSHPSGVPHPDGLAHLVSKGHDIEGYRSKSWNEFTDDDAPLMDIIVTVCGNAAGETCPYWPRRAESAPVTVHWGMDDPAYVEPAVLRQAAFTDVYDLARARIELLLALTDEALRDKIAVQAIADIRK